MSENNTPEDTQQAGGSSETGDTSASVDPPVETGNPTQNAVQESVEEPSKEPTDESGGTNSENSGKWSAGKSVLIGGIVALISVLLAVGSAIFILPMYENHKAAKELAGEVASVGDLQIVNTTVVEFTGNTVPNAPKGTQKALVGKSGGKTVGEDSGVFVFSNGKNANQSVVEIYVDFNSQRSRDFMLINHPRLQKLVEGGIIDLHIKPVPTNDALNMYSIEALAKTASTQPDKTWPYMIELLKLSAKASTDKPDDLMGEVVKAAEKVSVKDMTKKVVGSGTFASWTIATGDDERLLVGYYPPIIYIDDNLIDQDKVNVYDEESFTNYIVKQSQNSSKK